MAAKIKPTDVVRHLPRSYDIFLLLIIHHLGVAWSAGDIVRYFYHKKGDHTRICRHLHKLEKKGYIKIIKVQRFNNSFRMEIRLTEKGKAIINLIKDYLR